MSKWDGDKALEALVGNLVSALGTDPAAATLGGAAPRRAAGASKGGVSESKAGAAADAGGASGRGDDEAPALEAAPGAGGSGAGGASSAGKDAGARAPGVAGDADDGDEDAEAEASLPLGPDGSAHCVVTLESDMDDVAGTLLDFPLAELVTSIGVHRVKIVAEEDDDTAMGLATAMVFAASAEQLEWQRARLSQLLLREHRAVPYKLEVFAKGSERYNASDGAMWDQRSGRVVWVDNDPPYEIHAVNPLSGRAESTPVPVAALAVAPLAGGDYLLGCNTGLHMWSRTTGTTRALLSPREYARTQCRCLQTDRQGRVYVGCSNTDGKAAGGAILLVNQSAKVTRLADAGAVGCVAGLAMSKDGRTLYAADADACHVIAFDVDTASGEFKGEPRVAFEVDAEALGVPSCLSMDASGHLWVGHWFTGAVTRHDVRGSDKAAAAEVQARVTVPSHHVTSVCFGGPMLQDMFITASRGTLQDGPGARAAEGKGAEDAAGAAEADADIADDAGAAGKPKWARVRSLAPRHYAPNPWDKGCFSRVVFPDKYALQGLHTYGAKIAWSTTTPPPPAPAPAAAPAAAGAGAEGL